MPNLLASVSIIYLRRTLFQAALTMLARGRKYWAAWNHCSRPLRLAGKPCAGL